MYRKGDKTKILELASEFSEDDVGYGRDEHGRLKDWEKWSQSHPEKGNKVHICSGRNEWESTNSGKLDDQLSIISWNILSDTWYEKEVQCGGYCHTPKECGMWEGRFPIFVKWISHLRPDVLTLQEVDYDKFESDILPELRNTGYDGFAQKAKNQSVDQPCGVATFWLKEKLEVMEHKSSFSRSMAIHFRYTANEKKHVCVVNVHLESSQSKEGAQHRARQLNSPLEWVSRVAPASSAVFVSGDCNTGADASLFNVLRTHEWHGHDFASVYEHPATSQTLPVNRATFAVPGHHYVIDHMLYSYDTASLRVALNAFTPMEIHKQLGPGFDKGFPNGFCPSDHLPIGAIFDVADITERPKEMHNDENSKPQFTKDDLTKSLDSVMTKFDSLESYFARGCRNDIIRLLTEEVEADLECPTRLPFESNKKTSIAKFVKRTVGKAYGKWIKDNKE